MGTSTIHKLISAATLAAVLLCLIAAGLLAVARLNGIRLLSAQSGSMAPAVRSGDLVLVRELVGLPRPGSVVSFQSADDPRVILTHRVVAVDARRGTFVARGDANATVDASAPVRNIYGVAVGSVPLAGHALDTLRHPLGLVLAVHLPAAAVVLSETRRLSRFYGGRLPGHYTLHGAR